MAPYINAILDRFAIDYPPLPPGSVAKGYLVDWSVDYGHFLGPARRSRQGAAPPCRTIRDVGLYPPGSAMGIPRPASSLGKAFGSEVRFRNSHILGKGDK